MSSSCATRSGALRPAHRARVDPLRSHAYLALTIDSVHVEVSLEVCPEAEADVKNLRARLGDPDALLELTSLLETMPEEFAIGVIGVPSFPRRGATADDVRRSSTTASATGARSGWVERQARGRARLHERSRRAARRRARRARARVQARRVGARQRSDRGAGRGAWRAGRVRDEERRERGRESVASAATARRPQGTRRDEGSRREREDARTVAERERAGPASRATGARGADDAAVAEAAERGRGEGPGRSVPARRPMLQTMMRARGARPALVAEVDPKIPIEKGTRVRVLAGAFANKHGIVQELD